MIDQYPPLPMQAIRSDDSQSSSTSLLAKLPCEPPPSSLAYNDLPGCFPGKAQ